MKYYFIEFVLFALLINFLKGKIMEVEFILDEVLLINLVLIMVMRFMVELLIDFIVVNYSNS